MGSPHACTKLIQLRTNNNLLWLFLKLAFSKKNKSKKNICGVWKNKCGLESSFEVSTGNSCMAKSSTASYQAAPIYY